MAYFRCKGLAVYKWEKWDSLPRYSYNTEWKTASGGYLYEYEWSEYAKGSSYFSFSDTTGQFTVSTTTFTLSQSYQYICYGSRKYGLRTSSPVQTTGTRMYNSADVGSNYKGIAMIGNVTRYDSPGTYKVHNSYVSHYIQGSTDYGEVKSTDKNAYPDNGRHTDGYWYVKITA